MAANTAPIYSIVPKTGMGPIATANTAKDGTGTVVLIFTAGANGGRVDKVIAMPKGTNIASVLRLFMNNGSDPTSAGNNTMIAQATLPATTNSEVAALAAVEIPLDLPLPAAYRIYATVGTTVAAGFALAALGGDY